MGRVRRGQGSGALAGAWERLRVPIAGGRAGRRVHKNRGWRGDQPDQESSGSLFQGLHLVLRTEGALHGV